MTDHESSSERAVHIVTGGGTGIGAATAAALAAAGGEVVICGRRPDVLDAVAERTGAHPVVVDLQTTHGAADLIEATLARFGRLDGLVLNAGIVRAGTVADLAEAQWKDMVETNLTAPFRLLHNALPHLVESRGAVVGVGSVSAIRASAGTCGYNATKAGFSMLIQSVAIDHGPSGVRANVVCPGWTRTEMADAEMAELAEERRIGVDEAYQLATAAVPLARAADAGEVAALIAWLLSPAASYINAAVIPVDGGHSGVDVGTLAYDQRVSLSSVHR
ncbi:SDR family NAD(P)-dependent oxidoreductase [Gordonia polyisoprenivorans]|uniref:SDR family NAD(P)-dependent oxidoreductase n=1 Tax=Gordonia polyisoprenivorans TaxID=84595 RepID=UPI000365650D|nr:SDR family oxidoreductase [Gordonia polyisoprenivorans]